MKVRYINKDKKSSIIILTIKKHYYLYLFFLEEATSDIGTPSTCRLFNFKYSVQYTMYLS